MKNMYEVFILAGGRGERLRSVVADVPKPMAPIGTRPFLDFLLDRVLTCGYKNVCLLVGYKSEIIIDYLRGKHPDLNIRFSVEDSPLGTGGAIHKAVLTSAFSEFLVLNGDTFFNIDLSAFSQLQPRNVMGVALKKVSDSSRYGIVEVDTDGRVLRFCEKMPQKSQVALINGGIYRFGKEFWLAAPPPVGAFSLETEMLPKLVETRKIYGSEFADNFIDIGVPEDYLFAQSHLEHWVHPEGQ